MMYWTPACWMPLRAIAPEQKEKERERTKASVFVLFMVDWLFVKLHRTSEIVLVDRLEPADIIVSV